MTARAEAARLAAIHAIEVLICAIDLALRDHQHIEMDVNEELRLFTTNLAAVRVARAAINCADGFHDARSVRNWLCDALEQLRPPDSDIGAN